MRRASASGRSCRGATLAAALAVASCASADREPAPPAAPAAPPLASAPRPAEVPRTPALLPGIELPEVMALPLPRADRLRPQLAISPTLLTLRGVELAPLVDGEVPARALEGGAAGVTILPLAERAAALADRIVVLQVDRRVPYRTLARVLATLAPHAPRAVWLLLRSGPELVSVPLALAAPAADPGAPAGAADPLGLVVDVTRTELRLWSRSGEAGTADVPALRLEIGEGAGVDARELARALGELRARHPAAPGTITLAPAGDVALRALAEVLTSVIVTPDGAPLFADVRLAPPAP